METNRLEGFSDAVFAIVITLLIIDIKVPVPEPTLLDALARLWPSYLAYAISFIVIGAIWINHHGMFQHIVRTDNPFLLLNLLQLMAIAFLPFPTAVLAEALHTGSDDSVAVAFYGLSLVVVGVFINLMWWYAARDGRLLRPDISTKDARRIGRRFLVGPTAYAIAAAIGLMIPWLALTIYVALNVFYLWPRSKASAVPPGASTE